LNKVIPRKRFGQHFLTDPSVLDRISDALSPASDDFVLEIGPGTGVLTDRLTALLDHLTVVELDRDLAQLLSTKYDPEKITIIQQDILNFDFSSLDSGDTRKLRVIGNLPYNISTPLLFHLIGSVNRVQDMIFMVQKEVALRLSASPGDKNYGRLSVMSQLELSCRILFDVPPESFDPPPRVNSAVIRLLPEKADRKINDTMRMSQVVKSAFAQRRKTLRNALRDVVSPEQFETAEIDPGKRAETLSVDDFIRLANA
jgi:16S rRNA (adenine1518-N6/adenine1519-N6)-dimethyltransferase